MATQDVKIGVNISDNGTANKTLKNVKDIHSELKATQQTAQQLSISSPGGTPGSRAVYSKAAPQGSEKMMSGEDYGRARGSAGATGASARDFANQAQGLGGLVRLYATYAANLFAVSAAFSALKNAADTTALVSGLDKLGAASGRNLGTLSKQLVAATDGAVSLREAMTATAQTSSAGMSGQNILRLASVAKNASLALGVAMPDALNRLSRGITKLEPELLDELGLFTKIGPATEAYALQMGKAVSQLTDFERRQAFANAVLEEGEQKFAALGDAAANPYDKLLSSLKNVGQSGLEVINKVLQPAVELLAKSPVALGAGIAAVASVLLRQAVPALNDFRQGLEESAKAAGLAAVGKAGDAKRAREQLNSIVEKKVEESANAQLKTFEDLEKQLYASAEKGVRRRSSLYQILKKDIVDITDADIASAEKSVKALESRAKKDPVKVSQAGVERQTLEELKKVIEKEDELVRLKLQNREAIEKNMQGQTQFARIQKAALDYEDKARKQSLVSNAAYNASLLGIRNAFVLLKEEIALSGLALGKFGTGILYIRAGMASLIAVAVTLGSVINKAFFIFSTVAAIFGVLDSVLSTSSKQAAVFTGAIDAAEGSLANVDRTLGAIKGKGGFDDKTIQSTFALSNALTDLADSANSAIKSAATVKKSMGVWDSIWDNIFSVINLDVDSKLAKTISQQISSAIKLLRVEGLNKEYEDLLKTQLKVTTLDPKTVADAFNKLSELEKAGVGKTLDAAKMKLGNISSELQNFKSATDTAVKSYKELIQSTANTNPLFKVGEAFQNVAFESQKLIEQGLDGLTKGFDDLVKNPDKAIAFGEKFVEGFAPIRTEFTKQKQALDSNSSALTFYEDRLSSVNDQLAKLQKFSAESRQSSTAQGTQQALSQTTQQTGQAPIARLQKEQTGLQEAVKTLQEVRIGLDKSAIIAARELFVTGIEYAFKKGAELANKALNEAYQRAALNFAKAAAGALTGERRAQEENRLAQEDLKIQLNAIDTNLSLLNVQEKLVAEMQLSNAYQSKANAISERNQKGIDAAETQLQSAIATSKLSKGTLTKEDLEALSPKARIAFDPIKAAQDRSNIQQKAQRALIESQQKAQKFTGAMAERGGAAEDQQKLLQLSEQINQQLITRSSILQSISGINSKGMILQQVAIENSNLELKQKQELAPILQAIVNANASISSSTGEGKLEAEKELIVQNNLLSITKLRQTLESSNKELQDRQKLLQSEYEVTTKRFETEKQIRETLESRLNAQIEIKEAEFNAYSALLGYSEEYINNVKLSFELQKSQAAFVKATAEANATYDAQKLKTRQQLEAIESSLGGDAAGPGVRANIEAIIAEDTRARAARDTSITQAGILLDKNTQIANVINKAGNEQARFNELLSSTTGFAETLKTAFGDIGEKLGTLATTFAEVAINSEKRAKAEKAAEASLDKAWETMDYDAINAANKNLAKTKKQNAKEELADDIKTIASTKNLFKEKTAAYKILNGIERVMHLTKLAMDAKELSVKLGSLATGTAAKAGAEAADTGLTFAGTIARLPAYAAEIYGKTIGQLGPIAGPLVATALVAAMFSMFGKSGGVAIPNTGTGTTFGDKNAVSESLSKSTEVLKPADPILMRNSASMLRHLRNIDNNIAQLGSSLIKALPGGGDIASEKIGVASGFNPNTTFVTAVLGGAVGLLLNTIPLFNKVFSSISKALGFGTKTSVGAQGIMAGPQTLGQIQEQGFQGQYFADVTTSKKAFGITYDRKTRTQTSELDQTLEDQLGLIFLESGKAVLSASTLLGHSTDEIAAKLDKFVINIGRINLSGLSAEDQQKRFEAVVGAELDRLTLQAYPQVLEFIKVGEGAATTLSRLVVGLETADVSLNTIGISAIKYTDIINKQGDIAAEVVRQSISGIETQTFIKEVINNADGAAQDIIDLYIQLDTLRDTIINLGISQNFLSREIIMAAGGTDKFTTGISTLFDKFTSEGYKVNLETTKVITQFNKLGIAIPKTRQEFYSLFTTLATNAPESAGALLQVVDSLDTMYSSMEKSSESLDSTITRMRDFSRSILDFKSSLLLGSANLAVPFEKYALASSTLDKLYAQALSGDKDAQSKFQSAASAFLETSKVVNASSDAYQSDFNKVLDMIDKTSISALASADVAQLQLNATNSSIDILTRIEENTAAMSGVPAYAGGGRASGLSLVGERGPELVDFTNPGRVYTADQTAGMFSGKGMASTFNVMVAELQYLREEVCELRKDQQKQTGDLIISNYDANQKAAEEVASAVTTASADSTWTERSKSQIK